MQIDVLDIADLRLVRPRRFGDDRGWFSETFRADVFAEAGVEAAFIQDNLAFSAEAGVVRGLHWQAPPRAQAKLVQVLSGEILDVAVDIRKGSPTYGQHVSVTLTAVGGEQLFVPAGFAHGYCTLTPNCVVAYKVTDVYAAETEGGLFWNDPDVGIEWPVDPVKVILSKRDERLPRFSELDTPFAY